MASDPRRTVEAVWRIESAALVAALARRTGDVGLAEDCAQAALVAALEQWPTAGVPERPGAWLFAVARRRSLDHARRTAVRERGSRALADAPPPPEPDPEERLDRRAEDVGDELLGLMFAACHPALSREARVALALRLLGGLTTAEIARAWLVPEATMAQRLVRAKRTLSELGEPFGVPRGDALAERLDAVLETVGLVFNEGYAATAGDDWVRPALCDEALRLARVLSGLADRLPAAAAAEVFGLQALLELQAARLPARTGPDGAPVLLLDQDRARWDRLLLRRGAEALARAAAAGAPNGRWQLQAAIAACHARALDPADTDWARIAALYGALERVAPNPVVTLNRAVAVGRAAGPEAGLALLDPLRDELADYPWLWSARADLLDRAGRPREAADDLDRALARTGNAREAAVLRARRDALRSGS